MPRRRPRPAGVTLCPTCGCCSIGRMGTCVGGCGPHGGRSKHDRAARSDGVAEGPIACAGGSESAVAVGTALPHAYDLKILRATSGDFRQTERSFQSQVVRYARLMGWACYFVHDSRHSPAGWPDLVMVRRPRVVFAELKAERGKTTPEQRACLAELRACNQEVYLWRPSSWEEVERVLR